MPRALSPSSAALVVGSLLASGCLTDVGECDLGAAQEIVFLDSETEFGAEDDGLPLFAGQAIVHSTCGNGSFCHSSNADGALRYGVPRGFDFDLALVCVGQPCLPFDDRLESMESSQRAILDHARAMIRVLESGRMPPGEVGREIASRGPRYRRVSLAPGSVFDLRTHLDESGATVPNPFLPDSSTAEGREIVRNWIACGAPVIESTANPGAGSLVTGGDCSILGEVGHVGACRVRIEPTITPPESNWPSIYERLVGPRCGSTCHTPTDADSFAKNRLDLSDVDVAFTNLVGAYASGSECASNDPPLVLVDPGNPDESLFLDKVANVTPVCGDRMPNSSSLLSDEVLDPIRAWISAGAQRD